ncbi:N-acetylglucosamine-6-phosphate deacetylase [Paenibacillus sp. TRM 82003]|nr:N-acetylglucosamine-6-phosphate deacetylase [Paenibacillus sp. TRM 82003]
MTGPATTTIRGNVVTPEGVIEGGVVRVEYGVIVDVAGTGGSGAVSCNGSGSAATASSRFGFGSGSSSSFSSADFELPDGSWIVPGFIDVHVHGGYGADFMDATPEAYRTITSYHGRHGTTSMLATTMTAPKPAIDAVLAAAAGYIAEGSPEGARLLGVHLEGPFISPRWPGAQNPSHIVPPNEAWVEEWASRYPGLIRLLTLAPEAEGAAAVIRALREAGIVAAAGHTDASYDRVVAAADEGLSHAVHTFNAMTGLHHREPGVVGAVLTDPRLAAEVIADGVHVHPAAVKLLTRTKTDGSLMLVTDAMSAAGLGDGDYSLGGLDVTVRDGVARLTQGGSLAGSTLTMIDAFRFMVRRIGLSVPEASRLASANAAARFGLADRFGAIRPGAAADLVLLSPELEHVATLRDGRRIG